MMPNKKQATIKGLNNTVADNLAKENVVHVEKATTMNDEISRLKGIQVVVQYKLSLAKIKHDRMKTTLPF